MSFGICDELNPGVPVKIKISPRNYCEGRESIVDTTYNGDPIETEDGIINNLFNRVQGWSVVGYSLPNGMDAFLA